MGGFQSSDIRYQKAERQCAGPLGMAGFVIAIPDRRSRIADRLVPVICDLISDIRGAHLTGLEMENASVE
jgi:hypothetical protein